MTPYRLKSIPFLQKGDFVLIFILLFCFKPFIVSVESVKIAAEFIVPGTQRTIGIQVSIQQNFSLFVNFIFVVGLKKFIKTFFLLH